MSKLYCTAVIGFLLSTIASAGTYYVDKNNPSASDSGPGSEAVPWLTLNHMTSAVAPGDHIYIKGGTSQSDPNAIYTRAGLHGLNISTPGTSGHVITIEGYPGDVVVFQGDDTSNVYGIKLNSTSYHTFKNLVFKEFQVGIADENTHPAKTNLIIDHCEFRNCLWGATITSVTNLTITDTMIHDNFYNGMFLTGCNTVRVERCQFYNNDDGAGAGGDSDGFSTNLVTNLLMVDCDSYDNSEDGFDIQAEGALINCTAYGMQSFGMKSWRRSNDSYANHPLDFINCLVYDNVGNGILLANGNETHIYNCTIANNGENGILVSSDLTGQSALHSNVVNCIIYGNGTGTNVYNPIVVYAAAPSKDASWMVVDCEHNLFYGNDNNANLVGVHSNTNALWTDPCFVAVDDFHLQSTSPAIDAGIVVVGYHNSNPGDNAGDGKAWYGSAPDVGAYEVALSAITDLSVSGTSQNSMTLVWTVPSDQGLMRKPSHYDIRYADSPLTEANWDTATRAQSEPAPGGSGDHQSFTITGLNPGATYYVGIKVLGEVGRTSALSNVVSATTAGSGNHAPVLMPIGDRSVVENGTLLFTVGATDADPGDTLTYSAMNLPAGASFDPTTRMLTWTATNSQSGPYRVTFQVSDGQAIVSEAITITVGQGAGHAPVLAAIGNKSVNENASLSFSVSATDQDGDALSFSATGLPSGASFAGQTFSWTPGYDQAGSYSVTFTASDGELTDSEPITITVVDVAQGSDLTAPAAHDFYPAPDAIQAPLNPLITLAISDGGSGVDASAVVIQVNDQLVYSGDSSLYESAYGVCRRMGTRASYRYYYRPAKPFDFSQQVSVRANASDAAHNAMTPVSYQFVTEMHSFGRNQPVSSGSDSSGHPAVATDSQGNFWAAWHAGPADARDIYIAKRGSQEQQWDAPLRLTNLGSDQCNPAIAIGSDDALYVAWQDNRRGNWDIYVSVCTDGSTWRDPVRITDSNDNQTNPVMATDHANPYRVYIAWEDDGAGNQDIYLASSSASFAGKTIARITSSAASQTNPALAVGPDNIVYLVWTDQRNGSADIYGSSSSAPSWANVPIATGPSNQRDPALAVGPGASRLHMLWVDDAAGNADILYGTSEGLPGSPISGTTIIDDTTNTEQSAPTIVTARDHENNTHVYACWQDHRSVGNTLDSDLYFVELRSGTGGTNILVGDDGTNSNQSDPALAFDEYGQPVIVWTDSRGNTPAIYSAYGTYFKPVALASAPITRLAGGRVGKDPASITGGGDVSIQIPSYACDYDTVLSISAVRNPPGFTASCMAGYEIGPSGVQFSFPATVTIPYLSSGSGRATPYWYDAQTGTLSQEGMTEITNRALANGLSVVSFQTTHLTSFYVLESPVGSGGGGPAGGCELSPSHEGNLAGYLFPYAVLALYMVILRCRDRRHKGDSGNASLP